MVEVQKEEAIALWQVRHTLAVAPSTGRRVGIHGLARELRDSRKR